MAAGLFGARWLERRSPGGSLMEYNGGRKGKSAAIDQPVEL